MNVDCPECGCHYPAHRISCERVLTSQLDLKPMKPEAAINGYVLGVNTWQQVVECLRDSQLLTLPAVDYLTELSVRMPAAKLSERRDAVESLLRVWPLARHFGLHDGRVVQMRHEDSVEVRE